MTFYFYVSSFPKTKLVLIEAGLNKPASAHEIPYSLTLSEAVAADAADRILRRRSSGFGDSSVVASLGVEVSSSREHP